MEHQINEDIRDKEVRLISDTGEQLGIVTSKEAMDIAIQKGMDLVCQGSVAASVCMVTVSGRSG